MEKLTKFEENLLDVIKSVSDHKGRCYTYNGQLARKLNVHEFQVKNHLEKLIKKGFIRQEIMFDDLRNAFRILHLTTLIDDYSSTQGSEPYQTIIDFPKV